MCGAWVDSVGGESCPCPGYCGCVTCWVVGGGVLISVWGEIGDKGGFE